MKSKQALVFGASGFIGGHLLHHLLESDAYANVIVVVRRPLNISHPKLTQHIGDFDSLPSLKHVLIADDVFCAVGTTRKKTPDLVAYRQVDYGLPVATAQIGMENGAKAFFLVSSVGADADSSVFYLKTKGEAERDIIRLGYESTHIFRPAAVTGNRQESRPLEKIMGWLSKATAPLLQGSWKKFRPIDGQSVARAMLRAGQSPKNGVHYYYWNEITTIL